MNSYVHGHHPSVLRSHGWRTAENSAGYLLPHLRGDERLLDIGTGPGTIAADLTSRVAQVTVTEMGESELDLARATMAERGITGVQFDVEDVHALSYPDDSFDVVHAHQVLQHVADPVTALAEMRRVMAPEGLVAARDSDYAGFIWWPRLPELDEWLALYRAAARAAGGEPDAGRRLLGWARAAGFSEITASSSTWCYADPASRAWWGGMWAERIIESAIARTLVDSGAATTADLQRISDAWRRWASDADGWLSVLHGEIVARG